MLKQVRWGTYSMPTHGRRQYRKPSRADGHRVRAGDRGSNAEGSAHSYARSARLIPLEGGVARPICPKCHILIEDDMGRQLVNEKEFIVPELVGGR